MLCARVVRGAASRAKLVRPAAASASRPGRSNGLSMPTSPAPLFIRRSSSAAGERTLRTRSAPRAPARSLISAPAASPTQPAGARILIVEDDFGIASNLETFLSLRGFAVDAVYSGQAALHRCSVDRFDVILLDVGLPGLDGLTFLRRLRDELRA